MELRATGLAWIVRTAKTTILGTIAAAILHGSAFAWFIGSRIGNAIKAVTTSMWSLADGDTTFTGSEFRASIKY